MLRRSAALAAVVAACALVLALLVRGPAYELTLTVDSASQLVKGDQVKVGGVPVGKVSGIGLADDGRARLKLSLRDDELTPLHAGTTALIRSTSLAGIANRYVAIFPGPNNAPEIPDGGEIPADDATAEVDLDAVLNTLGPSAQRDLHERKRQGERQATGNGPAHHDGEKQDENDRDGFQGSSYGLSFGIA